MRILSHVCCGPCFTTVFEKLAGDRHDVEAFYYNPNIHPRAEYRRRLAYLKSFCDDKSIDLKVGDYDIHQYFQTVVNFKEKIERCKKCYRLRLKATAELAAAGDFDAFTTTLLLSPWQFHDELREIGDEISETVGVSFYYQDFRPNYRHSVELSKAMGMYRQKYCGCLFSENERYLEMTREDKGGRRQIDH